VSLQTFKKRYTRNPTQLPILRSTFFPITRILSYYYSTDPPFITQNSVQSTLDLWDLTFLIPNSLLFFKMGWKFATPTTLFISSRIHITALASHQNCTLLGIEKETAQNTGPDSPTCSVTASSTSTHRRQIQEYSAFFGGRQGIFMGAASFLHIDDRIYL
jgi:hypothetical protein